MRSDTMCKAVCVYVSFCTCIQQIKRVMITRRKHYRRKRFDVTAHLSDNASRFVRCRCFIQLLRGQRDLALDPRRQHLYKFIFVDLSANLLA